MRIERLPGDGVVETSHGRVKVKAVGGRLVTATKFLGEVRVAHSASQLGAVLDDAVRAEELRLRRSAVLDHAATVAAAPAQALQMEECPESVSLDEVLVRGWSSRPGVLAVSRPGRDGLFEVPQERLLRWMPLPERAAFAAAWERRRETDREESRHGVPGFALLGKQSSPLEGSVEVSFDFEARAWSAADHLGRRRLAETAASAEVKVLLLVAADAYPVCEMYGTLLPSDKAPGVPAYYYRSRSEAKRHRAARDAAFEAALAYEELLESSRFDVDLIQEG